MILDSEWLAALFDEILVHRSLAKKPVADVYNGAAIGKNVARLENISIAWVALQRSMLQFSVSIIL
jgi:hypothetical protein